MEYLNSYNEGLFNWRRKRGKKPLHRELSKDDLYLTNANYEKRIGPSRLSDKNTFYALRFPDMDLKYIKDHIVASHTDFHYFSDIGVFGIGGSFSWDKFRYLRKDNIRSTTQWFDLWWGQSNNVR